MIRTALISLTLASPATAATIGPEPVIEVHCDQNRAPWYCADPVPLPLIALLGDPWAKRPTFTETFDVPRPAYPAPAFRYYGLGGGGTLPTALVANSLGGFGAVVSHSDRSGDRLEDNRVWHFYGDRIVVDKDCGCVPDEPEVIPLPMPAMLLLGALAGLGFIRRAK